MTVSTPRYSLQEIGSSLIFYHNLESNQKAKKFYALAINALRGVEKEYARQKAASRRDELYHQRQARELERDQQRLKRAEAKVKRDRHQAPTQSK